MRFGGCGYWRYTDLVRAVLEPSTMLSWFLGLKMCRTWCSGQGSGNPMKPAAQVENDPHNFTSNKIYDFKKSLSKKFFYESSLADSHCIECFGWSWSSGFAAAPAAPAASTTDAAAAADCGTGGVQDFGFGDVVCLRM